MKQDEYFNSKINTETLEQQNPNSWTPVTLTKDKVSSPNHI